MWLQHLSILSMKGHEPGGFANTGKSSPIETPFFPLALREELHGAV